MFANKFNNTFTNEYVFTLNESVTYIKGNFNSTENSNLIFVLNNKKTGSLNVSGCIEIYGKFLY